MNIDGEVEEGVERVARLLAARADHAGTDDPAPNAMDPGRVLQLFRDISTLLSVFEVWDGEDRTWGGKRVR
jgi:hypothetical protein